MFPRLACLSPKRIFIAPQALYSTVKHLKRILSKYLETPHIRLNLRIVRVFYSAVWKASQKAFASLSETLHLLSGSQFDQSSACQTGVLMQAECQGSKTRLQMCLDDNLLAVSSIFLLHYLVFPLTHFLESRCVCRSLLAQTRRIIRRSYCATEPAFIPRGFGDFSKLHILSCVNLAVLPWQNWSRGHGISIRWFTVQFAKRSTQSRIFHELRIDHISLYNPIKDSQVFEFSMNC